MRGFTLVETMVVIAITLFMSGMVLGYNRSTERQIVLFREQAVIVGVLNRAKSLAIERFYQNPRVCAFGIYFSQTNRNFILFQDLQAVGREEIFGCRDDNGNFSYNGALIYDVGEEVERFSVDSRLSLELKDRGNNNLTSLTVVFVPPEISIEASASLPAMIVLRDANNFSRSNSITVGEAGQLTVN